MRRPLLLLYNALIDSERSADLFSTPGGVTVIKHHLLALAALSLSLAGCSAPTAPGTKVPSSDTPKAGGTMNVRVPDDPGGWDLSTFKSYPAWEGHTLGENGLLGYKTGPDIRWDDRVLRPELAERWDISPDARSFTFSLRKGVKYANAAPVNGRELTAEDVQWSFEYASRTGRFKNNKSLPQGQYEWMFEGLDRVDVPDRYTAVVRFKEAFIPFLSYAASDSSPIVAHEIYDQDGHLKDRMVGTGPFQLDAAASQAGSRWVWKKNPTFYESGKPYIDQVNWLVIRDDASASAAFKSKQVDYLGNSGIKVNLSDAQDLRKAIPNLGISQHGADTAWHLYLNVRPGQSLNDIRLRRAITRGIDRDEFIRVLNGGNGRWGLGAALPDTFSVEEIKQMIPYDPEGAKRLVAEAGYPNGIELEMIFPGKDYGEDYITGIQLLQSQLKKIGVNLNLKSVSKNDYSTRKKTSEYVIVAQKSSSLEGDLDSLLFAGFHSKSKKAYPGSQDSKLDTMLEAQRREPDPAKRQGIIRDAVRYIHADSVYDIGIHYSVETEVWQPYVRNHYEHLETRGIYPVNVWLDK